MDSCVSLNHIIMKIIIVIPVHNEETIIEQNIHSVLNVFDEQLAHDDWKLLIAENGSTDRTAKIIHTIIHPRLHILSFSQSGKGRTIREAWRTEPNADIYAFMDADLASDLKDIPALFAALSSHDIAIGSRRVKGAHVTQTFLRRIISFAYTCTAHLFLNLSIHDLQCGFKAVKKDVTNELLPLIQNDGYFFDTELIALATLHGFRIAEVPIHWQETPDPRRKNHMHLGKTSHQMFLDLIHLRKRLKISRNIGVKLH